jgi:trimethylamine--corrinoid protein Co-methyltransferase
VRLGWYETQHCLNTANCRVSLSFDPTYGLMRGVELSPESLALDVIDEVGPGGSYLGTSHTVRHFRETWSPRLLDRRSYQAWVDAGQPTAVKTAREIARQVIAAPPVHPLPPETSQAVREIISEAEARAGPRRPAG